MNGIGSMDYPYGKYIKWDLYLIPNTKVNFKWIKEKTYKVKHSIFFYGLRICHDILDKTPEA